MKLLEIQNLTKNYPGPNGSNIKAVSDVSFTLRQGEILGIVGESGCGKSTLGHSILRLIEPNSGKIFFEGKDLMMLQRRKMKLCRRHLQIIFQDPFGSLNPRHKVGYIIEEPLIVHRTGSNMQRKKRVQKLLSLVGLPKGTVEHYPHEFSGGQRQRIAIARALALNPKLLVADESVSALDVSIQSQILNLITELREKLELSVIFISHDLSVVRHVSDRIAVMYLGKIVEIGKTDELIKNPCHPYTQALLAAVPSIGRKFYTKSPIINGEPPDPANPPKGCAFNERCPDVMDVCKKIPPTLLRCRNQNINYQISCHLYTK